MSKAAVDEIRSPQLSNFLRVNSQVFLFASAYPDSGYVEKEIVKKVSSFLPTFSPDTIKEIVQNIPFIGYPTISGQDPLSDNSYYGEVSHWWPFLKKYRDYILSHCPHIATVQCQKLVAHWLGCAAHSIQDEYFDRHFVNALAQQSFSGNTHEAASAADVGIDLFLLAQNAKPVQGNLGDLIPIADLAIIYQQMGQPFTQTDIRRGSALLSWMYQFELLIPGIAALKYSWDYPWLSQNYQQARGGINDSAQKTARYLELLWQDLLLGGLIVDDVRQNVPDF